MSAYEKATELEDKLFLAMLDMTRSNAGPEFDLVALCHELQIDADPMTLISFTADNEGIRGTRDVTTHSIRFKMNAEGRRHALALEEQFRTKSFRERLSSVPRSDWIAIGAFVVSLIALFK